VSTTSPALVPHSEREGPGIDYVRKIVSGEYAMVPIGEHLGFHVVEADPGRVAVVGRPDRRSYNLLENVHGGWTAAILDTAMALSTLTTLDAHHAFTTLDIRINYLRPITMATGEVRAEGQVIQGGRRIAYCEARLVDGSGKLLAHGTGSCLIIARSEIPKKAS
jgi:uncharacterized protein (TIGR00369 family)